jgi:hypothetical protein
VRPSRLVRQGCDDEEQLRCARLRLSCRLSLRRLKKTGHKAE